MTRHQQLKNEARRAEQRSDWARAIGLYKEAIRLDQETGSASDVGIYNRIGDLYLRQGDTSAAVQFYEEAADRYAAHGLHTSAIALCNKVLRIAPDRHEVYGRLARLHAATGLLAEARSAFLRFAVRVREEGRLSEALEAVQELVSLTGDEDLRTAFADQLAEAGLEAQAVAQLRLAYEARVASGRSAGEIRDRIVALDPDADPVTGHADPPPRATSTPTPPAPPGPAPNVPARPAKPADVETASETPDDVLDLEDSLPTRTAPARPPTTLPESGNGAGAGETGPSEDLQTVLTRFRSRVDEIVEETDHAVHYDLGVAYMGMGLISEAISEFQLAIRSPALMEASHALLGECFRARPAAGDEVSETRPPSDLVLVSHADTLGGDAAALPSERLSQAPREAVLPLTALDPGDEATGVSPADEPTPPAPEADDGVGDLAEMLFQARLAQHRVRRASEAGETDHAAHLELGRTYEHMGLLAEAVGDLVTAAGGPRAVADPALDGLERVIRHDSVDAASVRDALLCLLEHGREEAAEKAGRAYASRPGIPEIDRQTALGVLPGSEDVARSGAPDGAAAADSGTRAGRESVEYDPGDLDGIASPLEAVEGDLPQQAGPHTEPAEHAVISAESAGAGPDAAAPPPTGGALASSPASLFGEAEGLREAGRMDEAASHYYRALEMYEKERDALSALRVVDRLLGLRPDDVVLHHQRTEFAIMTNDSELLISAYLDLAGCLRRQNGSRSARTVYGRILDLDPRNAEARAGIAALDADELARERQSFERRRPTGAGPREPRSTTTPPTEFDEMFADLRADRDLAEDEDGVPDYESHHELGVAFGQMRMWEEAAREFKQAVQGIEDPLPSYELLGEALVQLRRYEEARRTLSTAASQPGPEAARIGIFYQLGVAHLRAGDRDEARRCLERVVRIDPERADAAQLLSTLSR